MGVNSRDDLRPLTGEPELRHVTGQRAICTMPVAVENGRNPTPYIDAVVFDGQDYGCAEFLGKGRKVGVDPGSPEPVRTTEPALTHTPRATLPILARLRRASGGGSPADGVGKEQEVSDVHHQSKTPPTDRGRARRAARRRA
jgi:hypothetical protein